MPAKRIVRLLVGGIGGLAVLAFLALGLPRLLASPSLSLSAAATQALAADGMTPISGMPAYDFHLINQAGKPVALSQFRGKVVILTFFDPVCYYDCPLLAQEMALTDRLIGPALARHVALVAVDANPLYRSVSAIDAFDREQNLNGLRNWSYLTSPSVGVLQTVWQKYGVQVQVVKNDMVGHPDLFYVIAPSGKLAYLSNPTASLTYFVGTAQLLANYTERLLHASAPASSAHALGAPPTAVAAPAARTPGPVAISMGHGGHGWLVENQGPYQVVYTTANAGRTWTDVGPPGAGKQGGLAWTFSPDGSAVVATLPYQYQREPSVSQSIDWGTAWQASVLPQNLAPQAIQALAMAATPVALTKAGLFAQTAGGGWTLLSRAPLVMTNPSVAFETAFTGFVAGTNAAARPVLLRTVDGGRTWTSVAMPLPAAGGAAFQTLVPVLSGKAGIDAVTYRRADGAWLVAYRTSDGGRTWQPNSQPVALTAAPTASAATVAFARGALYALSPTALGTAVMRWAGAGGTWQVVSPALSGTVTSLSANAEGLWAVRTQAGHPGVVHLAPGASAWQAAATPAQVPNQ